MLIGSIPIGIYQFKRYKPEFFPYYVSLIIIAILAFAIRFIYEWKKYKELSLIFQNGAETIGEIVDVHFTWAFGYIIYEYQYQEGKYRYKFETYPNKKAIGISVGQQEILYVNQEKPSQAVIRNLYLNTF